MNGDGTLQKSLAGAGRHSSDSDPSLGSAENPAPRLQPRLLDESGRIAHLLRITLAVSVLGTPAVHAATFDRGDCNSDGAKEPSDSIFLFGFLFTGEKCPTCDDARDSNDDRTNDFVTLSSLYGIDNSSSTTKGEFVAKRRRGGFAKDL